MGPSVSDHGGCLPRLPLAFSSRERSARRGSRKGENTNIQREKWAKHSCRNQHQPSPTLANSRQLSPTLANSRQWNLWREKTTGGFLDDFTPPNAPINSNLFTRTKNNPAPPKKGGDQKRPARKSYKRHSSKSPPATPASISQPTRTVSTPSSFPIFSMTSAT